jgi:hypothetical protein
LCIDFNGQEITSDNEQCRKLEPDPNHYQLIECKPGYTRFSSNTNQRDDVNGDQCRKNCGDEID